MGAPYITGKGEGKLAGSWALALEKGKNGSAVAIDLSDDDTGTSWLVVVKAHTAEGDYIVGSFRTRPPRSGDPKARTIAIAFHPGVYKWGVDFYGPRGATARPVLATSDCACGVGFAGIIPQNGSRLERRIWSPFVIASQGILSPGAATLERVYGWTDPAIPAGLFFGFVDKASPVVNGDPFALLPVPLIPGAWFQFTFEPDGVPFANQIRFVMSSTPNVVTLAAAAVAVQAERI